MTEDRAPQPEPMGYDDAVRTIAMLPPSVVAHNLMLYATKLKYLPSSAADDERELTNGMVRACGEVLARVVLSVTGDEG